MENSCDWMELPAGFRFHPTDEELITHYLSKKVVDSDFSAVAIGDVDLNNVEPWELPWKAKMGEKEWYFFSVKDKKYPTGLRTNRATAAGYWKATGKDKEILRAKSLVGMKKTLVFYKGRAPRGERTSWVMHEYRLEGKITLQSLPKTARKEWVICRVFQKSSGRERIPSSDLMRLGSIAEEPCPVLPPLMDTPPNDSMIEPVISEPGLVSCFSNHMESMNDPRFPPNTNFSDNLRSNSMPRSLHSSNQGFCPFQWSFSVQDQEILRKLLGNYHPNTKQSVKAEHDTAGVSQEPGIPSSSHELRRRGFESPAVLPASVPPVDLDCDWNY